MPNIERLHAVLDHIKTLPDAVRLNLSDTSNYGEPMWDQRKWIALPPSTMMEGSCATAGCFAGWAVMMYAGEFTLDLTTRDYAMIHNVIIDGESIPIQEKARTILELNGYEADALFDYDNDLPQIERVIGKIEAGVYDPEFGEPEDEPEDEYADL